jgi:DNA-binding response OmpR family regulator
MRLLLVEEDPRVRTLLRHHLSCKWPEVRISAHPPLQRGPLPPEFLAQGYDAVLYAAAADDEDGIAGLHELRSRPGFAPVIFMQNRENRSLRERAMDAGAYGVLVKNRIEHEAFLALLEAASRDHKRALADWRVSPEAIESRRFGEARIPEYRRARLLARGSVSQLYVAESEKAGTLVVLKVTPSRRDESGIDQVFARFLQEYEIAQRVRHPNIVRL